MQEKYNKIQEYEILRTQLENERASMRSYWKDLSNYILPRRSRFFTSDINRGDRRNLDIIDSTATLASRTLGSGMMTGITSPARPWFRLGAHDTEIKDEAEVKQYLKIVEERKRDAFLRSNLYNILPTTYEDTGTFGVGCLFMEEDLESVFNFTSFLAGSYMIGVDKKGRVRVFFRDFQMTVRQIVEKFGYVKGTREIDWSNISSEVKNHWEKKQLETRVNIAHCVKPNDRYDPSKLESKYKEFVSVYYERGLSASLSGNTDTSGFVDKFLSEKGYDYYPVLCPRWQVAGEDSWGTNAPGMICLGDVKQLQLGEKRSAQAIDHKVRPTMVGPTSLRNANASILPGEITYIDEREGTRGFRPLFEVTMDIRELEGKQQQIRDRISRTYYEDLFMMLASSDRKQITAREVEERHEEKLLALGPVLERLNQDLLDPLIDNAFIIMNKQGLLPEPPESLQGREIKIEYISIMAQAQKLAGIGNIERVVGFVGQVAQLNPEAVQKLDVNNIIDIYSELTGAPPNIIISKEEMLEKQQALAEEQAQAQQMEQNAQMVEGAKTLSETKMDEDTALNEVLSAEDVV